MGYKSILTIVTDPKLSATQIDAAVALARREDAHLDILCLGIDRAQTGYYYAGATAALHQETFEYARAEAAEIENAVRARMASEEIRWAVDTVVTQIATLTEPVAVEARFSDLVVLPQPYGGKDQHDLEAVLEAALFDGRAPVLVLPPAGLSATPPQRIVIAWNQSDESLIAIRAALPILKAASIVNITVIDPPSHGPERSDPGGLLSQFLARHGVKTEVSVLAKTLPRVSEVLCRHARDIDADMIVMGGYGHSRFREAILGGATRDMLEIAQIPVLMAH
ncbi:universal stress protein [Albidovulum sediminicola]|uniref:Universal stress protein n=1 Tax=Albidovulum sediminicola TaxID=2984331 RepID=A0ABT2YX53_9RHOB|nr:universal stress protein [Defluviimonas sp. WL0075]MCV2863449.1 universal stress protein [Defluviimonas sp. WL0075]